MRRISIVATTRVIWIAVVVAAVHAGVAMAAPVAVGEIVALDGTADIERAGNTFAAATGAKLELRDKIRTYEPGRVRLLFKDGSTVVVGDASELIIDDHVFSPDKGTVRSMLRILRGKIRAIVSDYYSDANASYRIETPGAVAGVRGTEFIVDYDVLQKRTDVVTVTGRVAVNGVIDRSAKAGIMVAANEISVVKDGLIPTPPRGLSAGEIARYLDGFQLSGIGEIDATLEHDAVLDGSEVPQSERPVPAGPGPSGVGQDPGGQSRTPGDPAGQPIPALEGPGQVEVPF